MLDQWLAEESGRAVVPNLALAALCLLSLLGFAAVGGERIYSVHLCLELNPEFLLGKWQVVGL